MEVGMMKRILTALLFILVSSAAAYTQAADATRDATRERLRQLLDKSGPAVNVAFRQSDKQPYNFVGTMTKGLTNAESLEIVISVSSLQTIHFRVFPHYKAGYINVDKARNNLGLARLLLNLSYQNFLFWGMDESSDVFAGYTVTLESGFPEASINVVLRSIQPLDEFVGRMKPFIDGTAAAAK
jgi:hypothetical protein